MGWLGHEDHILDGDDAVHDHEGVSGGPVAWSRAGVSVRLVKVFTDFLNWRLTHLGRHCGF